MGGRHSHESLRSDHGTASDKPGEASTTPAELHTASPACVPSKLPQLDITSLAPRKAARARSCRSWHAEAAPRYHNVIDCAQHVSLSLWASLAVLNLCCSSVSMLERRCQWGHQTPRSLHGTHVTCRYAPWPDHNHHTSQPPVSFPEQPSPARSGSNSTPI